MSNDVDHEPHPMIMRRTRIVFQPGTSTPAVIRTVQSLDLGLDAGTCFRVEYGVTEIVFNALRATIERGLDTPVVTDILDSAEEVNIKVEDGAGGFDTKALPYDFAGDVGDVDIDFDAFDEYSAHHDRRRFGLGLLTVRGMMDSFSLVFVDVSGREAGWQGPGTVNGTRVQFSLRRVQESPERRAASRHVTSGCATLASRFKAHIHDFSMSGVRLVFLRKPLPQLDEIFDARIVLNNGEPLTADVRMRIARAEKKDAWYDVGGEFIGLSAATVAQIERIKERIDVAADDELDGIQVELLEADDDTPPATPADP